MKRSVVLMCLIALCGLLEPMCFARAAEPTANGTSEDARRVFDTVRSRIYQVRALTTSGDAVASSGSGFLVGENGLIATNWHVVDDYLLEPEHYRLEVRRHDNTRVPVHVIAIDSLNDLALLRIEGEALPPLPLQTEMPAKGGKGFAMGDPKGVGFTVVEGTFNGLAAQSMAGHLHFSGAINAGMSGGPTVDATGAVVGVNVARRTDADLMGFLVPAEHLAALIARAPKQARDNVALLEEARQGVLQGQARAAQHFIEGSAVSHHLGKVKLPAVSEERFRCRGRSIRETEEGYATEGLQCNNDLSISVGRRHGTGTIGYDYQVVSNLSLDPFRFAKLVSTSLVGDKDDKGDRKVVGRYVCKTSFLRIPSATVRATLCVRPYLRFSGLKEAHLRFATVDSSDTAIVGDLILRGFTDDSIRRVTRRFMEGLEWKR